ncbi:hypothetical protein ACS0TY_011508 [Phlomoides rotata]
MLLTQQRCGDTQVPSKQHGLSFNSLSNRDTIYLLWLVHMLLSKSYSIPIKLLLKDALIVSIHVLNNVKVVFKHEEELIRPYGNLQKFAHVLGEMIDWPCNLVTPSEG